MNAAVWTVQVLLAAVFFLAGRGKLTRSVEEHVRDGHLRPGQHVMPLRILGVLELSGCVGIIAPWWTGVLPVLTPLAAVGFGLVMAGAIVVQVRARQYRFMVPPLVLLPLCVLVAWYRLGSLYQP